MHTTATAARSSGASGSPDSPVACDSGTRHAADEFVHAIVEGITDVVAVTDLDLVVRWVSPSVTARLGYRRREMLGRPFTDRKSVV